MSRNGTSKANRLECSCCGKDAGKFHQHLNRDAGYGICRRCVEWILSRGESPDDFRAAYGKAGYNYEAKQVRMGGRLFDVLAEFAATDVAATNAYMIKYPGASVLLVKDGIAILADAADLGVPCP